MKIVSAHIVISEDGNDAKTIADYSPQTGFWKIEGMLYPKHMKILTTLSDMCREADRNK